MDEASAGATVPGPVTGPPWAGVLPPRGGWRQVPGLPGPEEMGQAVAAAVAEFRARDEALPVQHRTRSERDRIGREIWSRTLGDTELPLRAVHAAQSLGFLRPVRAAVPDRASLPGAPAAAPVALLAMRHLAAAAHPVRFRRHATPRCHRRSGRPPGPTGLTCVTSASPPY